MDDGDLCKAFYDLGGRYGPGGDVALCWEEGGHEGDHYSLLETGPGWRIKIEWANNHETDEELEDLIDRKIKEQDEAWARGEWVAGPLTEGELEARRVMKLIRKGKWMP